MKSVLVKISFSSAFLATATGFTSVAYSFGPKGLAFAGMFGLFSIATWALALVSKS